MLYAASVSGITHISCSFIIKEMKIIELTEPVHGWERALWCATPLAGSFVDLVIDMPGFKEMLSAVCACAAWVSCLYLFFLCKVSNVMLFLLVSYDKLQWLKCAAMIVTPWGCTEELRWKKVKWKFKNCNLNLDSKVLYLCNKLIMSPTRLNSLHTHPPLLLLIIIW